MTVIMSFNSDYVLLAKLQLNDQYLACQVSSRSFLSSRKTLSLLSVILLDHAALVTHNSILRFSLFQFLERSKAHEFQNRL